MQGVTLQTLAGGTQTNVNASIIVGRIGHEQVCGWRPAVPEGHRREATQAAAGAEAGGCVELS